MATNTLDAREKKASNRRDSVPGSYFGTDGRGFEHYYSVGTRIVTMVDPETDERKTMHIPEAEAPEDAPLLDYAIHVVEEWEAYWEEIRLDEPKRSWLKGDVPVGEPAEGDR